MPRRMLFAVLIALASLQATHQIAIALRPVEGLVADITIDDTFYYLETARNHVALGFATFDGINETNGVQLLWYLVVVGLASIFSTPESLLTATLVLCALLNLVPYLAVGLLAQETGATRLGALLGLLWLLFNLRFRIAMIGMENSLYGALLWLTVTCLVMVVLRSRDGRPVPLPLLTGLLVLLVWTRLDAALFAILFFTFALWRLTGMGDYTRCDPPC